jgi:dTDP-4-amino-4,6-dideoxygalactose transaminase
MLMIDEFCESVRATARAGNVGAALRQVMDFVEGLHRDPATTGVVFESSMLDALCVDLAKEVSSGPQAAPSWPAGTQLYLATELYATGGHTRVLLDFIDARPDVPHAVVVTNPENRAVDVATIFGERAVSVAVAPSGDLAEKLAWLLAVVEAHRAHRIYLFHHHGDAAIVGACGAVGASQLYFYHHADHHLTLGCHLPCAGHLDNTAYSWHRCRSESHLPHGVYVPITVPTQPVRRESDFAFGSSDPRFVVCTAGNEGKFSHPYDFSLASVLPRLLEAHGGTHLHIGPLSDALRATLSQGERFRHYPHVPSLAAAMHEFGVSVYLGSWPLGGVRGIAEVLATGTPVVGHRNYTHPFLGCQFMMPTGCPVWSHPDELLEIIRGVTSDHLLVWSRAAHERWASEHCGDLLGGWLRADPIVGAAAPTPIPTAPPDPLRAFLTRRESEDSSVPALTHAVAAAEAKAAELRAKVEKERAKNESLRAAAVAKPSAAPPRRHWLRSIWSRPVAPVSKTVLANDFRALWEAVGDDVLEATRLVGASGWYVLGKEVEAFEQALAESWDLPHAVGMANGMDALEIALRAAGLKAGERVLTTPMSAFATTLAIVRAGGVPVFCDVDAGGQLDFDLVEQTLAADPEIKWMIPVHLYGHALDAGRMSRIMARTGLRVVEDCAQAIGARSDGQLAGTFGIAAATSFYPTKNLGAFGDGGALLTSDADLAARARQWRDYGQSAKYVHSLPGLNSRLDELQAAILRRAILPRLPGFTQCRREIARRYLSDLVHPDIAPLPADAKSQGVWHLFPVKVEGHRDDFMKYLKSHDIQTGIHYPGIIPDQPAMAAVPHQCATSLERARALAGSIVSLPIHPFLTDEAVGRVIDAVNAWPHSAR